MHIGKPLVWLLMAGLAALLPVFGAEVSATVSANPVGTEDTFQLKLEAREYTGDVQFPRIGPLAGLEIVGGPSTNRSFQFVNGQSSRLISHTYALRAPSAGSVTIPAFTIQVDGKPYQTKPINLTVKEGRVAPQRSSRPRSLFDVWDDALARPRQQRTLSADAVFLRTELDRSTAYVGEGILVSYRLYASVPVSNLQLKDLPDFTGFLTEDLMSNRPVDTRSVTENGKRYDTAIIFRKILYPTRPGQLVLPEVTFAMQVGDRFSMFAGSSLERSTGQKQINVRKLPAPEPPGFSGAVGRFDLETAADTLALRTGESLTLSVNVTGRGDFNNVPLVFPDKLDGFKLFRPSSPDLQRKAQDPMSGSKRWDIVLVPQRTGDLTIPALELTYFDPQLKRYESRRSEPIQVKVTAGDSVSVPVTGGGTDVVAVGQDISYIRTPETLKTPTDPTGKSWFRTAAILGPLLLLLMGFGLRFTDPSRKDPSAWRKAQAFKVFKGKLKDASRLYKRGKNREFYQTISQACIGYFADKWDRPVLDMKIDEIARELTESGTPEVRVRALVDLVEYCDFESYTPSGSGVKPEIMGDAEKVIGAMEKQK